MPKPAFYDSLEFPKTLIIGIETPDNRISHIDSYFEEFLNLVKTDGIPYEKSIFMRLRSIDSTYFLTKGKLEEIRVECDTLKIERVIFSETLSPKQARNLEDYLETDVLDRTDLILSIFDKATTSAEGRAQVEIAKLQRQKTRLAGKGIGYMQQEGAVGIRGGPGETAKERERRHIENLILRYKRELEHAHRARDTQRKKRLENGIPQICLIGYTNAGKSTILNALTKSNVLAENKLFSTLTTTTRSLIIDGAQKGTLSDTVGFIQQLPHHLIEAFKSTLSELQYADLLLQIIDFSDPNWQDHIRVVHGVLNDLDVQKPMLYVFNKSDKVTDKASRTELITRYQPHVIVSATTAKGLEPLLDFLRAWQRPV